MNSIGYVAVYGLFRWHITHEIFELIEHHDRNKYTELILPLSVVQHPDKNFIRLNDREFRYKGKMYDIVSQKLTNNTVHFIVIHDKNDERNFNRLAENTNLQSQTPGNMKTGKSTVPDTFIKVLFSPLFSVRSTSFHVSLTQNSTALSQNMLFPESPCIQVPVPPPRMA